MTKEYIIKENKGSAFKSKSEHPNAPKYAGKGNIDGVIKQIDVWINKRENGDEYLSFEFKKPWVKPSAKPKEEKKVEDYRGNAPINQIEDDEFIPF